MNTVELELLSKVSHVRDTWAYAGLKKEGFSVKVFSEPLQPIFRYVEEHWQKYKDLPTQRTLTTEFPELGSMLSKEVRDEPLGIIYGEVIAARKRESMHSLLEKAITLHQDEETGPDSVMAALQTDVEEIYNNFSTSGAESNTFAEIVRNRRDELLGTKHTDPGYAAPFLFMEEELGGFTPGEITVFLAKTSVGKSWALFQSAVTAAFGDPYHFYNDVSLPPDVEFLSEEQKEKRRGKVLILSLEMSVMAVAHRLLCLITKISFNRFKKGSLKPDEAKKLSAFLDSVTFNPEDDSVQLLDSIKIVGPNTAHDPETLNAAAEEFKADLVLVDGFYYMTGKGEKRWEKVEENMQKMRLQTLRTNRHYIIVSQMKPAAKTMKTSDGDSAAFSQSITQDANNVLILVQEPQQKKDRKVVAILDKARDGVSKVPYLYDWDHYECKYGEIGMADDDEGLESEGGVI